MRTRWLAVFEYSNDSQLRGSEPHSAYQNKRAYEPLQDESRHYDKNPTSHITVPGACPKVDRCQKNEPPSFRAASNWNRDGIVLDSFVIVNDKHHSISTRPSINPRQSLNFWLTR
jgi:hypothetical protein